MMGFSETLISFYKYPAASKGFGTDYYYDFEHQGRQETKERALNLIPTPRWLDLCMFSLVISYDRLAMSS
jgi:hypothetical protein